jgi:5'-nucleotidase
VAAIIRDYDVQVRQLRETRIGATEVTLQKSGKDELIANLCTDALRSGAGGSLKADFAFQNGGGLRIPEIAQGPIAFGQIFDLYPFDNLQIVVQLPANQVRNALEAVLRAGKGPLKVSGLRYTVDWDKFGAGKNQRAAPPGAIVTEVVNTTDGKTVCKTLSCAEGACESDCAVGTFTLSVTDFLANGGDGLTMLKDAPRQTGPILARDILVAFVKEKSPLTAGLLGAPSSGAPQRVTTLGSLKGVLVIE